LAAVPAPEHPLAARVVSGDVRALARVCRLVDDGVGDYQTVLKQLFPHTGHGWTVGVTGMPGSGKSTLTDKLIANFRGKGWRVAVLAIDPTSPYTGGAILGDRIRMQRHYADPEVFIRSVATRGALGGLSRSAADIIRVLDAWRADVIVVETVGVGQDELEVTQTVDTTLVVMAPGMGDEVQAIKAGILECADVFAVNKADREGADATHRDLELMLALGEVTFGAGAAGPQGHHGVIPGGPTMSDGDAAGPPQGASQDDAPPVTWRPAIVRSIATRDEGTAELVDRLEDHRRWLYGTEAGERRRLRRLSEAMRQQLRNTLIEHADLQMGEAIDEAVLAVSRLEVDPYTAAEELLARFRGE